MPTLILLTLAAFALNTWARGDPAEARLRPGGAEPTREAIAKYRAKIGLNDPLVVRYVAWMGNLAQGDLGRSFLDQRPVSDKIGERIVPTLRRGVAAFLVTTVAGVGFVILFGLFPGSWFDIGGRFFTQLHPALRGNSLVLAGPAAAEPDRRANRLAAGGWLQRRPAHGARHAEHPLRPHPGALARH